VGFGVLWDRSPKQAPVSPLVPPLNPHALCCVPGFLAWAAYERRRSQAQAIDRRCVITHFQADWKEELLAKCSGRRLSNSAACRMGPFRMPDAGWP
jgi:hypothetical protein